MRYLMAIIFFVFSNISLADEEHWYPVNRENRCEPLTWISDSLPQLAGKTTPSAILESLKKTDPAAKVEPFLDVIAKEHEKESSKPTKEENAAYKSFTRSNAVIISFNGIHVPFFTERLCNSLYGGTYFSYVIQRAWFDSDFLYILYKKSQQTIHYSSRDIDGTIAKKQSNYFIKQLPRASLKESESTILEDGESAPSIIYRDKDFILTTNENGDETKLVGRNSSKTLLTCTGSNWSANEAIRVQNQLFYCGVLFDKSGNRVWEVPKTTTQKNESEFPPGHPGPPQGRQRHPVPVLSPNGFSAPPRGMTPRIEPSVLEKIGHEFYSKYPVYPVTLFSVLSKGQLLTTRITGNLVRELVVNILPFDKSEELKWVQNLLPNSASGYGLQNQSHVYSPSGFVLSPSYVGGQWIQLCDESSCKRIDVHEDYAYLVVDDEQKQVILLVQNNMRLPAIAVKVLNY